MTFIEDVLTNNGKYSIAKSEEGYWAIHEKYLDQNRKLIRKITGLQGLLSKTLDEVHFRITLDAETNKYRTDNPNATELQIVEHLIACGII